MSDVRLIDANALDEVLDEFESLKAHSAFTEGIMVARREISLIPTIDAVPVVRCRECEYRGDELKCPMCFDEWDEDDPGFLRIDKTVDDGFCHMGAKMDGGVADV